MPTFAVIYVKGRLTSDGPTTRFDPLPGQLAFTAEAASRSSAYVQAYKHLTRLGMSIFVMKDSAGDPLGFTDAEVKAVHEAEVPLDSRATSGIRIDKIIVQI